MLRPSLLALRLVLTAALLAWLAPAGVAEARGPGAGLRSGAAHGAVSAPEPARPSSEVPLVAALAAEDCGDQGDDGCNPAATAPEAWTRPLDRHDRQGVATWRERHWAGAHLPTGPPHSA